MPFRTSSRVDEIPVGVLVPGDVAPVSRRLFVGVMASVAAGVVAWDLTQIADSVRGRTAIAGESFAETPAPPTAAAGSSVLTISRGDTSLDLRPSDLALFPTFTRAAGGRIWSGVAVADLLDAVGAGPIDTVRAVTRSGSGGSLDSSVIGRSRALRDGALLALHRDGRRIAEAHGGMTLITGDGRISSGRLISLQVTS